MSFSKYMKEKGKLFNLSSLISPLTISTLFTTFLNNFKVVDGPIKLIPYIRISGLAISPTPEIKHKKN